MKQQKEICWLYYYHYWHCYSHICKLWIDSFHIWLRHCQRRSTKKNIFFREFCYDHNDKKKIQHTANTYMNLFKFCALDCDRKHELSYKYTTQYTYILTSYWSLSSLILRRKRNMSTYKKKYIPLHQ